MDEPFHRKPVTIHRGLLNEALVFLACAGCEQLGLGKTKGNPVVPPPPERKLPAEAQSSTAKSATAGSPVKLDGSAVNAGSTEIPNAPAIAGSQPLAAPRSLTNSPANGVRTANAGSPRNTAGTGEPEADGDPPDDGALSESDDSQPTAGREKPRKLDRVENREADDASIPAAATQSGTGVAA